MKFLTSSSSSSASSTITTTTATSFDPNAQSSKNTPGAGCIAGVFRRLLCLNNLPTHPSDHDSISVEFQKLQSVKKTEEKIEGSSSSASAAAPSIVARLMGLESFPQIDFSALQKSPNSVARSRSMNSVDLMKELASIQGRHRHAKSFREPPTFVELQDDNFFILSFENEDEFGKFKGKPRKSEMGSGQKQTKQSIKGENSKSSKNSKRRESIYENNKENLGNGYPENIPINNSRKVSQKLKDSSNILRPTNGSSKSTKPISHKPDTELQLGRTRMKKRKDDCLPVKKIETECDSENSSPSSVLDIMKIPTSDPEVTSSKGEVSRLANSKSRRTLAEDLENYRKQNHESIGIDSGSISKNASCRSRTCEGKKIIELLRKDDLSHKNLWGEMSKMAGKFTVREESNWINSKEIQKFEEYIEISGAVEKQILEDLVGEIVDQLVGIGI